MLRKRLNIILLSLTSIFLSIVLIFFGNFVIYNLIYIFVFIFIVLKKVLKGDNIKSQIFAITIFAGIMVIEMVFNALVINSDSDNTESYILISKVIGTVMVFIPFIIEQFVIVTKYDSYDFPSIIDSNTISYSDYLNYGKDIRNNIYSIKQEKEKIKFNDIVNIMKDMPKHSSFKYINKDSLSDEYFKKAYDTINDNNVYIVLSNTGSAASKLISLFTKKVFNHISISFDSHLETIISYNGGENLYPPGLNPELIEWFNKKDDASIMVYKLDISKSKKRLLIDKVQEINKVGNAYNMLGLILKLSIKPNILFCSQFIYKLFEIADLNYFKKGEGQVKPTDFIELDYYRKLRFAYEIKFNLGQEFKQLDTMKIE